MLQIEKFTFNPFQENTYVVYASSGECVIIDPGCYYTEEEQELAGFIERNKLTPIRLLLTHAHIDHVLGCVYVKNKYGLSPEVHQEEEFNMQQVSLTGQLYGLPNAQNPPKPEKYLSENDTIQIGGQQLDILFTPGHSPGHLVFVSHEGRWVINGDVLFQGSIGRTDLPGGDFNTLISSIKNTMFVLPDDYLVYCGHGPETSIGSEKMHNPFVC